jgi:hypothetical protein
LWCRGHGGQLLDANEEGGAPRQHGALAAGWRGDWGRGGVRPAGAERVLGLRG